MPRCKSNSQKRCRGDPWNSTKRIAHTVHKGGVFLKHRLIQSITIACGICNIDTDLEGPDLNQLQNRSVFFVRDPVYLVVSGMLYHRSHDRHSGEQWLFKPASESPRDRTYAVYLASRQSPHLPDFKSGEGYQDYLLRIHESQALLAEMVRVSAVVPSVNYTEHPSKPLVWKRRLELSILKKNEMNSLDHGAHWCMDQASVLDEASFSREVVKLLDHWRVPEKDMRMVRQVAMDRMYHKESTATNSSKGEIVAHSTGSASRHDLHVAVCKLDAKYFGGMFFRSAKRVGCMPESTTSSSSLATVLPSHCQIYA